MAIVPAKCTSCNGTLKVKAEDKTAVCPFCGTEYLVQEAIEKYNITNVYNIEQASLTFDHRKLFNDRIEAAEKQLRTLKDYPKALASFEALEDDLPEEFRIWSGKVEAHTKGYDAVATGNSHMNDHQYINCVIKDYEYAYKTGDDEQKAEIKEKFLNVLEQSRETIRTAGSVLEDNAKSRKKYRRRSSFFTTIGPVLNILAIILGCMALLVVVFVLLVLASDNFESKEAIEFGLSLIGLSLMPSLVFLIPGILFSIFGKKSRKKFEEISNNTLLKLKSELHLAIPKFAPLQDYKEYIELCKKKEAHLSSIINKYTVS